MTAYGYVRVSTVEQAEGNSLAAQERKVRAAAEFNGETFDTLFSDAGVSGGISLFDRPASKRMIDVLKPGDMVIAAKLDRMFRSAADALEWMEYFKSKGIKLILCDMGVESVTDSSVSRLMFSILAAMAQFEKERILERSAEGRALKAADGGHIGGKPPFGYMIVGKGKTSRIVPDPAFVHVIADLERCWLNEVPLRGASQYIHSKHGVRVSFNQVHRVYGKFEQDRNEALALQGSEA